MQGESAVGGRAVLHSATGEGRALGESDEALAGAGDVRDRSGGAGLWMSTVRPSPGRPRTVTVTVVPGACFRALVRPSWAMR